jgi:hypothetical protein
MYKIIVEVSIRRRGNRRKENIDVGEPPGPGSRSTPQPPPVVVLVAF